VAAILTQRRLGINAGSSERPARDRVLPRVEQEKARRSAKNKPPACVRPKYEPPATPEKIQQTPMTQEALQMPPDAPKGANRTAARAQWRINPAGAAVSSPRRGAKI